jgi:cysteinyl-tRNA synthetase
MMQAHYRSTLDFSNEALSAAEKGYERMMSAVEAIDSCPIGAAGDVDVKALTERCYAAMGDDFNTPILIAELFEAVRVINSCKNGQLTLSQDQLDGLKKLMHEFLFDVLGIEKQAAIGNSELPNLMMDAVFEVRKGLKENKDYATADMLRGAFAKRDIAIKDTKDGGEWKYEKK